MSRVGLLLSLYRLKHVPREGWRLRDVGSWGDLESVAAHTWGTALLCLLFAEEAGVNPSEAVSMAIAHDVAEAEVGDVASLRDEAARTHSPAAKAELEAKAMADFSAFSDVPGMRRLHDLWEGYESNVTDVARFVRDMNLIDMAVQAWVYERSELAGPGVLDEFFVSAHERMGTPFGHGLLDEVMREREAS